MRLLLAVLLLIPAWVEAADITLGQDSIMRNCVIGASNNLVISATGCSVLNTTVLGTSDISQTATITNTVYNSTVDLTGGTPEVTYSIFSETKAAIENGGTFDATQTGVLFNTDAKLRSGGVPLHISPCKDAGTDLSGSGVTTDIRGVSRASKAAYDIGAYKLGMNIILDELDE